MVLILGKHGIKILQELMIAKELHNTAGGTHSLGGTAFRGNYAGKGFSYDSTNDVFIPPKNYDSWVLDETIWQYKAPKDYPDDGKGYDWDETAGDWVLNPE